MSNSDERGGAGRRRKPGGLVRPYVLGTGAHAGRRADQPDRAPAPDSGGQLPGAWIEGAVVPGPPAGAADAGRADRPGVHWPITMPLPVNRPTGHRRSRPPRGPKLIARDGGQAPLARRRPLVLVIVSVVVLAIVGGATLIGALISSHAPASACGTASCQRSAGSAPRAAPPPLPSARSSAASAKPSASTSATPVHSSVTVSFSLPQQWPNGFQGEFTIVNHGSTAINGWQLTAVLPGDQIRSTWDASHQMNGDTLILDPPDYQAVIAPGASLSEFFTAEGPTTALAGCTFNGAPC